MTVFVDTSYYVARIAFRPGLRFVTSSLVINETISLLQARGHFSAAVLFLRESRSDANLEIVFVNAATQSEAWDLFNRWGGSGASAVDCASFAIMNQRSIRKAFTFDAHFRLPGFEILR